MYCQCECCKKESGSSYTKETCKSCGKEWTRYRYNSSDWKYEDCLDCAAKRIIEFFKKKDNG